jgi:tetratricopeptide (TPR) repeat protein
VALKVLPFAATMDTRHLQRFQNEARAAASLEHPHIVPVYGVGCERGVHYYAMKFIEGQSLAAFLQPQRAEAANGPDQPAGAGAVEAKDQRANAPRAPDTTPAATARTKRASGGPAVFRQIAAWGIQAAEALEHAHGVGIVHRDIKPANLMIDDQGALWVTDFGLARTAADAGLTRTGDLLGTLRYMSPEQALAKHGLVDHRTDIYSLGAALYELLTGRPAIEGQERQEVFQRIADDEPPAPRTLNRAIPSELATVVLKMLAKEPAERYATAQQAADDLRRTLEDKPIRARRPSLAQRARRWARRHRRAVWATVVVAVLASGIGLWYQQDRAERRAEAAVREADQRRGAQQALAEARRLQGQARWPQARAVLAQALTQVGDAAPAELRQSLEQAQRDQELVARLDSIRRKKADIYENKLYWSKADRDYAATFREAGLLGDEGEEATVVAARIKGSAVRLALVAALDDWAGTSKDPRRRAWLLEVARRADPDPLRDRVRDPVIWDDARALAKLASKVDVGSLGPQLLVGLADRVRQTGGDAVPLLTAAQARYPDDFLINVDLAMTHFMAEKWEKAVECYRAALALRPEAAEVYSSLGGALLSQGRTDEALFACQQAVRLDANYSMAHGNLGSTLGKLGRVDEAITEYRRAIQLDPHLSLAHMNLGMALRAKGRTDECIRELTQAIQLDPENAVAYCNLANVLARQGKLAEAANFNRQAIKHRPDFAEAYYQLGNALKELKKPEEAEAAFRKAIKYKRDHVQAYVNLAVVLRIQKRPAESEAVSREAIKLKPDFAMAHQSLGTALYAQAKLADAEVAYRLAVYYDPALAEALNNLGTVLMHQGRFTEALAALKRCHEVGSARPRWTHPSAQWVRTAERLVELDARLARVLKGKVQPADTGERLALAELCGLPCKSLYTSAVRFYGDAFTEHPKLADDLQRQYRYKAACAGALAGCGQGKDADQTTNQERARHRRQALDWLRADLAAYRALLEKQPDKARPAVGERMQHWHQDKDFTGVRDPEALAKLPNGERQEWQKLWAEVDILRQSAAEQPERKAADRR